MVCLFNIFSGFSVLIVGIQIIRIVIPWIYENFIGPLLIGSNVNLKDMGHWALITGATDGIGKAYAKALAKLGINIILISRSKAKLEDVANIIVITGATDGIGKAYAKALAKRGINIVLVSRSKTKLEDVSKELEDNFKIKVKIIVIDFTTNGLEIYDKIEKNIIGLDIGILINNVGINYEIPNYFLSVMNLKDLLNNMITCNINSVTNMCRIILPGMLERKKGLIVNLSSMSAKVPTPLLTLYAATKAFICKFSEDLAIEYDERTTGVTIQCLTPGFIVTNMTKLKKSNWALPSADTFVESAIRTIGISRQTTGYYPHAITMLVYNFFGFLIPTITSKMFLNILVKQRDRILKRQSVNK